MPQSGNKHDIVIEDFKEVNADLRQRRQCRHTMFIACIGGIITSALAIIGFIQIGDVYQWYKWLLLGTMIPFSILSIGVLTSINKGRSINIRSGYLAAIAYYVTRKKKIPNFGGWGSAMRAVRLCANLTYLSPTKTSPCGRPKTENCDVVARKKAYLSNKSTQTWRRDIVKSFTVMTSMIYGILYFLTSIALIGSTLLILQEDESELKILLDQQSLSYACLLAILLLLAVSWTFFMKNRGVESVRVTISYIMLIVGSIMLLNAAIFRLPLLDKSMKWPFTFGWIGGAIIFVGLGVQLYSQVLKIRKGDYSLETYYQLWRMRLEYYPLMTGRVVCKAGETPGKGTYVCLNPKCSHTEEIKKIVWH